MNKEEIENIEKIKRMLNFTTEGTNLRINNEVSKLLLKYIQELEGEIDMYKDFKEIANMKMGDRNVIRAIKNYKTLDKVKELATKIATENAEKYNSENQKEVDFSEWNLALEILNIIEGEKK